MRQKRNISEKAYAHFTSHIRSVFSLTGQGTARVGRAVRALDEYIEGTRRNFDDLSGIPEVRLALMMIQPEIDKCLARSAAARARAKARREQKKLQEQQADESHQEPHGNWPSHEAVEPAAEDPLAQEDRFFSARGWVNPKKWCNFALSQTQ